MRYHNIPVLFLMVFVCSACVQTQPLISHAHLGHALTTWHDTPRQQGLLQTAQDEAEYALSIAARVKKTSDNVSKRRGIDEIGYVINPDVFSAKNYPHRYGVLRSLTGVLDHVEFAASSQDSSLNLVKSVNDISVKGEQVIEQFRVIQQTVQSVDHYGDDLSALSNELYQRLYNAVNGGHSRGTVPFYGLSDFERDFDLMVAREKDPRYEPLPKKYLLGVVRLPGGRWGFRIDSSDFSNTYPKGW
ncbi:MAG: hypothetical protein ACRBHB_05525 [Arenicella sp.]